MEELIPIAKEVIVLEEYIFETTPDLEIEQ